jgi:hypothetical protein
MHFLLLATPAKVPADAPYDPSLIRHCQSVGYCRSPGLWLFPQSVVVSRFRMPLWSGLVVRLLGARFGRRLDAVRCPWSPPRSGKRPARCAFRRLYPCAVRLPDWSPHAYIRMKISTMSTRTPTTNHPSPGKLMSWVGPPRITLLLPRSYRVAGSTVSRYVSNAGRSIYWSPRQSPVLSCQFVRKVVIDLSLLIAVVALAPGPCPSAFRWRESVSLLAFHAGR